MKLELCLLLSALFCASLLLIIRLSTFLAAVVLWPLIWVLGLTCRLLVCPTEAVWFEPLTVLA